MYNGIGLSSVRGSGTSGYVQRNLSHVPGKRSERSLGARDFKGPAKVRKPSADIINHDRKRRIEVALAEVRDQLEADGQLTEEQIEERITELRRVRLAKLEEHMHRGSGDDLDSEYLLARSREDPSVRDASHKAAAAKQGDDARFRQAFGIRDDHVVGEAFDRELQAERKAEKVAIREAAAREEEERRAEARREAEEAARQEDRRRRREERKEKEARREAHRQARREERQRAREREKRGEDEDEDGGARRARREDRDEIRGKHEQVGEKGVTGQPREDPSVGEEEGSRRALPTTDGAPPRAKGKAPAAPSQAPRAEEESSSESDEDE